MGHLDGKVAIVTGAGRGIGRGEARLLAAEGARVVVNDLGGEWTGGGHDQRPAQQVVDEIVAAGGEAVANYDDVSEWKGAQSLVDQAVDTFGRVDVVVNNAGIIRDKMCFNLEEDEWDDVIRVHLKGHFGTARFAAAYWRAKHKETGEPVGGRIVNTASEAGLSGNPGQANYVAAKAGIAGLTIGLGRELKKYGVTVNCIAPRARTRLIEGSLGAIPKPDDGFDDWDPDNIAPVVAWLATDEAADVNGQVFVVFGRHVYVMEGWTLAGRLDQDSRWTVGELIARKDELFGDRRSKLPPMGFGE